MLKTITSQKFRKNFKDSFGKGFKYNWFIMDHVGFKNNPRKRDLGFSKIWNRYQKHYKKNKTKAIDGFHFHHHPIPFSKSANHCATHFFNSDPLIYQILNRRIIENFGFRAPLGQVFMLLGQTATGFWNNLFFDFSNQSVTDEKDNLLILKVDWVIGEGQQKVGSHIIQITMIIRKRKMQRWSARCLNIGTRGDFKNKRHRTSF